MKYYVVCSCDEKLYIDFEEFQPLTRQEIRTVHPQGFTFTCSKGHQHHYYALDIKAEIGASALGGAIAGAFGYLIGPVAGTIGVIGGALLATISDQNRVEEFNRS